MKSGTLCYGRNKIKVLKIVGQAHKRRANGPLGALMQQMPGPSCGVWA